MIGSYRKLVTYKEPPLLLSNDGNGVFKNMKDQAGSAFQNNMLLANGMGDFDTMVTAILSLSA